MGVAERFGGEVERVVAELLARDRQVGLRLAQGIDVAGAGGERALTVFAFALRKETKAHVQCLEVCAGSRGNRGSPPPCSTARVPISTGSAPM